MPSPLERGVFTFSLDFELVWGSRDLYADPTPLLVAARTTRAEVFPALLARLQALGIVATWATVGHLFLDSASPRGGSLHPELVPPRHAWRTAPWLDGVPAGSEATHPEYYGRSLVLQLRDAGQEIGSHSFTHPVFGDPGCSKETADSEVARCVAVARDLGIELRSFVFPRNVHGHADVLARHGFTCWRGLEPVWYNRPRVPRPVKRLAHLADVAAAGEPPTVLPYRDELGLWCIPASTSFLPVDGARRAIPVSRRVLRAVRGIDRAAERRRISHFWIHPINLAAAPSVMLPAIDQILTHAARLRDAGRIDILPMGAIAAEASRREGVGSPSS